MLQRLVLLSVFALGACASPDSTLIVQAITQAEQNYAARASASDLLVERAEGISPEVRARYEAEAERLDATTEELFTKVKRIVSGWGTVNWRDVYESVERMLKQERGQ